jgi:hypothetical protein
MPATTTTTSAMIKTNSVVFSVGIFMICLHFAYHFRWAASQPPGDGTKPSIGGRRPRPREYPLLDFIQWSAGWGPKPMCAKAREPGTPQVAMCRSCRADGKKCRRPDAPAPVNRFLGVAVAPWERPGKCPLPGYARDLSNSGNCLDSGLGRPGRSQSGGQASRCADRPESCRERNRGFHNDRCGGAGSDGAKGDAGADSSGPRQVLARSN